MSRTLAEQTASRLTAIRQTEYEYLWVIGAVCPKTKRAEGLLSPQLNTKIVNVLLTPFAASLPADEQAVILWDGAGFHASKQLLLLPHEDRPRRSLPRTR